MKTEHKETAWKILRICLLFLCVLLVAVWLIQDPDALTRLLMEHTPQNPAVAALVILVLYLIKSLTVFFPLIVLEITVGYLFSPWAALPLNFAGILIVLTVPYWVGRAAGLNVIQKQMEKHPRFAKVLDRQQANSFFLCFFLRVISCLPGDVVTMYLGATKTPFWKNLLAGSLGLLPGMVLATFMGESVQKPQSPMFWICGGLMAAFAALSAGLYYWYRRTMKRRQESTE